LESTSAQYACCWNFIVCDAATSNLLRLRESGSTSSGPGRVSRERVIIVYKILSVTFEEKFLGWFFAVKSGVPFLVTFLTTFFLAICCCSYNRSG